MFCFVRFDSSLKLRTLGRSSSKCWHFILVSSGLDVPFLLAPVVAVAISVVWVAVTVVCKSVVSIPGISLGISSGLSISRSLAVVVVRVATIVAAVVTTKTVVAIHQVGVGLGVSSGGSLGISRPLAIVAVIGVAVVSTIVSSIVSKTISVSIVSVPGVSFSLGVSIRSRLSLSRSLAVVAVVRVAVVMMSKTVVASIDKIGISLWIGNCLCFSFRLAHGKDGQAENSLEDKHVYYTIHEIGFKSIRIRTPEGDRHQEIKIEIIQNMST